ncbi:MAG: lysoplasmalogenase [Actinomycetales bacterium]|nr:lysoplasmalogenase [Actinomycetales bacterium]
MRPTTAAYAALAALDSGLAASSAPSARRARKATKSALMPLLALDTAVATPRPTPLVRGVLGAQVLSWLGDVALLGSGDRRFLLGLGSFLAAHLGYIAAFSARDPRARPGDPGVVAGALLFAATGPAMARLAQRQEQALAVPVLLYAGVISTMLATATTLDRTLPPGARHRIVAGSALFVLSDTLLGIGRFALPDRRPGPLDTAVMATYTAGQWLIADGAGLS